MEISKCLEDLLKCSLTDTILTNVIQILDTLDKTKYEADRFFMSLNLKLSAIAKNFNFLNAVSEIPTHANYKLVYLYEAVHKPQQL